MWMTRTRIPGGLLHSELDKLKCPSRLTLQLESPEANSFYAERPSLSYPQLQTSVSLG